MTSGVDFIVTFLQCDRAEYTQRTLSSFVKYSSGWKWEGWYADDASSDREGMRKLAESHGMQPLVLNEKRSGCTPTTCELIRKVAEKYSPETPVLYLQNDFEFLRPIPFEHIKKLLAVRQDVGWVRTAGHWNSGPGQPGIFEGWIKEIGPATWVDYELDGEVFEIGRSYFAYNPPPFVLLGAFQSFLKGSHRELITAWNAVKTGKLAARFKNNVAIHIGRKRTDGFMR